MLPSREDLLAEAAALPSPPIAFGAGWDGDSTGWCVVLYARLSDGRAHLFPFLRGGSDFRIFRGIVPPWPEAQLALEVGAELAQRYGVPFTFESPDEPRLDDDIPRDYRIPHRG
jgi:hypothetical protein